MWWLLRTLCSGSSRFAADARQAFRRHNLAANRMVQDVINGQLFNTLVGQQRLPVPSAEIGRHETRGRSLNWSRGIINFAADVGKHVF